MNYRQPGPNEPKYVLIDIARKDNNSIGWYTIFEIMYDENGKEVPTQRWRTITSEQMHNCLNKQANAVIGLKLTSDGRIIETKKTTKNFFQRFGNFIRAVKADVDKALEEQKRNKRDIRGRK